MKVKGELLGEKEETSRKNSRTRDGDGGMDLIKVL
jgi:hypothetical protein